MSIFATKPPTVFDFSRALLLGSVEKQFNQKAKTEVARVLKTFESKSRGIDADFSRYQSLKQKIGGAETTLDDTLKRLKRIRDALGVMAETTIKAGRDLEDGTAFDGYRSLFDSQIDSIRSAANRSSYTPNLLTDQGGFGLSFATALSGATYTVGNAFVGTTYRLVEADGDTWIADPGANLLSFRAAGSDETSGPSYTTAGAVRLDARVGDSVTVTLGAETAAAATVTATLETTGLGIKDAWYYNGLSDAEGRGRALTEIDAALVTIDQEIARYETAKLVAARYDAQADLALAEISQRRRDLIRTRETEAAAIQKRIQQQLNGVSQAFSAADGINAAYRKMFDLTIVKPGTFGREVGRTPTAAVFATLLNIRT